MNAVNFYVQNTDIVFFSADTNSMNNPGIWGGTKQQQTHKLGTETSHSLANGAARIFFVSLDFLKVAKCSSKQERIVSQVSVLAQVPF